MIIDGKTIAKSIDDGIWKAWRGEKQITSKDLSIGVSSVDLTLGPQILRPNNCHTQVVDLVNPEYEPDWTKINADNKGRFALDPGEFVLATVQERFDTTSPIDIPIVVADPTYFISGMTKPHFLRVYAAPKLDGRSTVARMGLATHITASDGHYGFTGNFTLELVNHGPFVLVLTVGMRIAQLSFHVVTNGATAYEGAYATGHNGGPFPPKLGRERF